MSKLFVSEHPLIHTKMAMLRDEQTGTKEFREIIGEVASLLLYEATRDLPLKEVQVKTPIATATCKTIDTKLAMVPYSARRAWHDRWAFEPAACGKNRAYRFVS